MAGLIFVSKNLNIIPTTIIFQIYFDIYLNHKSYNTTFIA